MDLVKLNYPIPKSVNYASQSNYLTISINGQTSAFMPHTGTFTISEVGMYECHCPIPANDGSSHGCPEHCLRHLNMIVVALIERVMSLERAEVDGRVA